MPAAPKLALQNNNNKSFFFYFVLTADPHIKCKFIVRYTTNYQKYSGQKYTNTPAPFFLPVVKYWLSFLLSFLVSWPPRSLAPVSRSQAGLGERCLRGWRSHPSFKSPGTRFTEKGFVNEIKGLEVQMVDGPRSSPGQEVSALGHTRQGSLFTPENK